MVAELSKENAETLLFNNPHNIPEIDYVKTALLRNAAEQVEEKMNATKLTFLNTNYFPYEPKYEKFHGLRNPKFYYALQPEEAQFLKSLAFNNIWETTMSGNRNAYDLDFSKLPRSYKDFFHDCKLFFLS